MSFLVYLSVIATLVAVGDAVCPDGWMRYNDRCYLFKNTKMMWKDAKNRCDTMGGQLASIESQNENDFLVQTLQDIGDTNDINTSEYWVGGRHVNGTWVWENGSNFTSFDNWAPGEPNGGLSESCLGLYGHYNFRWNDDHCDYYYRFICETGDLDGDACLCTVNPTDNLPDFGR